MQRLKFRADVEFDESRIDAIFATLDQDYLPGAAIGIAIGGQPIYRKGFGLANMELPIPLSPTIRMRIGSTSKHLAALAYLLLCDDGKAGVDDSIREHLPELHPVAKNVTVRQLMGHLGGLRDAHDIVFQFSGSGRPVSSADILGLYRDIDDVCAAPGVTWNYNNGGYLLISAAIERIADQPLEEVLRRRIFEPSGMRDTLLRRWDTDFVSNSAALHMTSGAGGFEKSYLGSAFAGEGGIVSTVDDMLRWLVQMDTPVISTRANWDAIKTPQRLANGTSTGYGLGLISGRFRGVDTLVHGGSILGGSCQMLKVPAACLDVVIMANRHDVDATELVNQVLIVCLPGLNSRQSVAGNFHLGGTFCSPASGRVIELYVEDGQQIASIDGFDLPMARASDGALHPVERVSFIKQSIVPIGDEQRPSSIQFDDYGNLDELHLRESVANADSNAIEGRYQSRTASAEVRISGCDEGTQMLTIGRFGSASYRLECLAHGIFRARPKGSVPWWGGILSFEGEGGSFRFTTARNRALLFRRVA